MPPDSDATPLQAPRSPNMPFVALVLLLVACVIGLLLLARARLMPETESPHGLAEILEKQELVALSVNSPTTVYAVDGQWQGFDYDLIKAFAANLGVSLEIKFASGIDGLLADLEAGAGQFAIANLAVTASRAPLGAFSTPYAEAAIWTVCARSGPHPRSMADLVGTRVVVPAESSYVARLQAAAETLPELRWTEVPDVTTEGLFARIESGDADCALTDSNILDINLRYHPELRRAFKLAAQDKLAILIAAQTITADQAALVATKDGKTSNNKQGQGLQPTEVGLLGRLNAWLAEPETLAFIDDLKERYYGHLEVFDYVEVARFRRRVKSRLPRFAPLFETAGRAVGLPALLLAAQSYQESHWDPDARSPTGVAGIMMLTRATAREMGVKNRRDPAEAIPGGARYLASLYERLPPGLTGEDRMWAALAAYNIGFGHVLDARILAERAGEDKNRWSALRRALPKLDNPKYFRTVSRGRARGSGAVTYVDRIREFYAILNEMQAIDQAAPAAIQVRLSSPKSLTTEGG